MDRYNVPKFLERRMDLPFDDFKESIIQENKKYNGSFLGKRFKTKDEEDEARRYFRLLDCIVEFFLDNEMKITPSNCDSLDRVLLPVLENYVRKGELSETDLQAFEQHP